MGKNKFGKIKYEKIAETMKFEKEMHEKKHNILISNHIDGTFNFIPKKEAPGVHITSIGIPVLFFAVSLIRSKGTYEIEFIASDQHKPSNDEQNNYVADKTYIVIIEDNDKIEIDNYNEKISKFNRLEQVDPLNTKELLMLATKLNLNDKYEDIRSYEKQFERTAVKNVNAASRYAEVYQVIIELEELKKRKNSTLYLSKLNSAKEIFDIYFQERFAFGVIILGVYMFSVLANMGQIENARHVFFRTTIYTDKQYEDFTNYLVQLYKEILLIKSSAIFELDDYIEAVKGLKIISEKTELVFNINMAAKFIENNKFEGALEYLNKIGKIDQELVNGEGIQYYEIYLNNRGICELSNCPSSRKMTNPFAKIKERHFIFAFNYNLVNYATCSGNMSYVDIEKMFSHKLKEQFYTVFLHLQNAIINNDSESFELVKEASLTTKYFNRDQLDVIKKIKPSECNTSKQLSLSEVKILLIDFNIWDYLDW